MRRALLALGATLITLCPAAAGAALPTQDEELVADDVAEFGVFGEATFAELTRRGAAVDTLVVVTPDETWVVTGSRAGSVEPALEASSADFFR